jgi:homocysteine S-methyltransferase
MDRTFLEAISEGVVLADGAMGTEIYNRGVFINSCYDELNLRNPGLIRKIHEDYLAAGAMLIEANTYGANRLRLSLYGLEDKLVDINRKGVEIARAAADGKAFVAASIGPIGKDAAPTGKFSDENISAGYVEQITILAEAGIDLLILETFSSLEELTLAYRAARQVYAGPIGTLMTFTPLNENEFLGITPEVAAQEMARLGADIIGTNCGAGPQMSLDILERFGRSVKAKLAVMPNAGYPRKVGGRTLYLCSPEYMAEYAMRYVESGATLIGGCCGTTPAHIRLMRNYIRSMLPKRKISVEVISPVDEKKIEPVAPSAKSAFGQALYSKFTVCVEMDPPYGVDARKTIEGARILKAHGVDAVNIPDGPRAVARMNPMALGSLIQQQVGIETVVHYCCRDRNTVGLQMDLIGAYAMHLHNVLIITGDPPKVGATPEVTPVFDLDAIGLIRMIQRLNQGFDMSGKALGGATSFLVGAGVNPASLALEEEVSRYERKIAVGAEFIFSQPIYDPATLAQFFSKIGHVPKIPFLVGILPLLSYRNAEFFHNEVPGIHVPEEVLRRMKLASTKAEQQREGIKIAQEALLEFRKFDRVTGVYIFPPLGRVDLALEVMSVL